MIEMNLRSIRQKVGMSQAKMAEQMQTTVSAISRLESENRKYAHSPRVCTLKNYANTLGYELLIAFRKK